jgi:D-glycero-alpha-D-manno-heptose-7-phosphate kinase
LSVHARAPVRIDFAGGWTDVPLFADAEGGSVVNAAITRYVDVELLEGGKSIRLRAEDTLEHMTLTSVREMRYDGTLDLHKAALNLLPVMGGIEILSRTDLPRGSGLGGSGALDVALLAGLARCRGELHEPVELAELGFLLETVELKLAGGRQDQYAAALGGFNELTFGRDLVQVRPIKVTEQMAAALAAHALLVYTGQSHFSSDTHNRVWQAYQEGSPGVTDALKTMRALGPAAAQAVEASDWRALADVLNDNWAQQQRLDATIATPATHAIEDAARRAGAWGLKATGAGAGGCLVILAEPSRHEEIRAALAERKARVLEFAFEFDGVGTRVTDDVASE